MEDFLFIFGEAHKLCCWNSFETAVRPGFLAFCPSEVELLERIIKIMSFIIWMRQTFRSKDQDQILRHVNIYGAKSFAHGIRPVSVLITQMYVNIIFPNRVKIIINNPKSVRNYLDDLLYQFVNTVSVVAWKIKEHAPCSVSHYSKFWGFLNPTWKFLNVISISNV